MDENLGLLIVASSCEMMGGKSSIMYIVEKSNGVFLCWLGVS